MSLVEPKSERGSGESRSKTQEISTLRNLQIDADRRSVTFDLLKTLFSTTTIVIVQTYKAPGDAHTQSASFAISTLSLDALGKEDPCPLTLQPGLSFPSF